jgi:hypothetical protein
VRHEHTFIDNTTQKITNKWPIATLMRSVIQPHSATEYTHKNKRGKKMCEWRDVISKYVDICPKSGKSQLSLSTKQRRKEKEIRFTRKERAALGNMIKATKPRAQKYTLTNHKQKQHHVETNKNL